MKVSYEILAVEDNKLFTSLSEKCDKNKSYIEFYQEYTKMLEMLCVAVGWTLKEYMNEELLRVDRGWLEIKPTINKKIN